MTERIPEAEAHGASAIAEIHQRHASLAPARFETALEKAGLDLIERRFNDETCGGAGVWMTRKRQT